MLKVGTKRRRTQVEMADFRLEDQSKEEEHQRRLDRIRVLEQQIVDERKRAADHQGAHDILTQFNEQGLIAQDPDGQWQIALPGQPPVEPEQQRPQEGVSSMEGVVMHDDMKEHKQQRKRK